MADSTVIAVLTVLHVASAMGWLGGVMFFLSAVGPGIRSFSPSASLEFLTKVGPKQVRFFAGVSTAAIVFGLALLFAAFGMDYTAWPWYIEAGLGMGFVAYLLTVLVTVPTLRKIDRIARDIMGKPPGPPPPEFPRLLKRANMATMLTAAVLLLALVFMVSTSVFA